MSRKNRKQQGTQPAQVMPQSSGLAHQAEYRIIKFDLIKVVILNAVYLVIILALYYQNQRTNFLDNWFAKILHF